MRKMAIKPEKHSKAYQLGEFSTGTLSRDIERWIFRLRGKDDPFLKVGEYNDRATKSTTGIVWSLKDIDFEVERGEAVGIIGKNGAGKSTLLKILSKVTTPTTGGVKLKGRVASLLEVGTGFHPELTGKENIFLNGAILGMCRHEIKKKFDQIVDFAGVARYIDTPVKRYSSGMYVRLAFAVAAHLESEILIVDEVLAVGDAEFQEKCLGKMGDIRQQEGRTILFVSHNMNSIKSLCTSGIHLKNGMVESTGSIAEVIESYRMTRKLQNHFLQWKSREEAPGNSVVRIFAMMATNPNGEIIDECDVTEDFYLEMQYQVYEPDHILWHSFNIHDEYGVNLFDTHSTTQKYYHEPHPTGVFISRVKIPGNFLNAGSISVGCAIFNHNKRIIHFWLKEAIQINITETINYSATTARGKSSGPFPGMIRPMLEWSVESQKAVIHV